MSHHTSFAVPNEHLDVAVIDDSKTILGILRSVLNAMKVKRVRVFDSTESALHAMLHEPPNLVICEWRSGLVSGHQLLRMVRARFMEPLCFVPVIIMTATPTRAIVDKAMSAGANLIVVKPISPAILQERIAWLRRDDREMILGPRGSFEIEGVRESIQAQHDRVDAVRKAAAIKMRQQDVPGKALTPKNPEKPFAPPAAPAAAIDDRTSQVEQWQAFLKTKEQLERKSGTAPDGADSAKPLVKPAWKAVR